MNVLFSTSYAPTIDVMPCDLGEYSIATIARSSDWGKKGIGKQFHYLQEAIKVTMQARKYDALVMCTIGIEACLVAKLRKLFCPKTVVVCADFLIPRQSRLVKTIGSWLKGIDTFICIRTGDIQTLERLFGVTPEKCRFVPFPVNQAMTKLPISEGDYIYSAGWAYRDWPTLIQALSQLHYHAVLSPGVPIDIPEEATKRIQVLPMQSPAEGRKWMANAKVVVLSLEDTDLPSGPLVLLDAMCAGKAVVATNVNGTRDYVKNEQNALLVPPQDTAALKQAIQYLMQNDQKRQQIGQAASCTAREQFSTEKFITQVVEVCIGNRDGIPTIKN